MTEYVYYDSEDRFSDDKSCLGGMAKLAIEWHSDFSADIGGIDGHFCTATLVEVAVGNTVFTANQIAEMFGSKLVVSFEEWVAEYEATK